MTGRRVPFAALRSMLSAILLGALAYVPGAGAHESRPAYLQVDEIAPDRYEVLWRTPLLSGMPLPVTLKFSGDIRDVIEPTVRELSGSLVERRVVEAPGGLAEERIEFVGLEATITDVLIRVQTRDRRHSTTLVRPSQPWIEIAPARGAMAVTGAFLIHGVEHILFGYDHLLFVLALVMIVQSRRVLVWTITAFTAAHSITLSLATLGWVHLPGPPVEATIALSILLLACEIMRLQRGEGSVTARWPWVVAFSFGLLHGFGFASALSDIGLPQGDIPLALFAFNVGVEIGQLAFIALVLTAMAFARRIQLPPAFGGYARPTAAYTIGILAAFWFLERLAGFAT